MVFLDKDFTLFLYKKRETNYEEELNRLIDKLNEQDERENYSKRRNDYYAQKRSSRKWFILLRLSSSSYS